MPRAVPPQPERGPAEANKQAAFDSCFAYCGTYDVVGDHVVHHLEQSLFANYSL